MSDPHVIVTDSGRFFEGGAAAFEQLMAEVGASADPKLFFYVHGGLVSEDAGREEAEWFHGILEQYEPNWSSGYLVWRSGFFEVLGMGHDRLADDPLFRRLVSKTLARVASHVAVGGAAALADEDLEAAMAAADGASTIDGDTLRVALEAQGEAERTEHVEKLSEDQLNATDFAEDLRGDPELRKLLARIAVQPASAPAELLDPEILEEIAARRVGTPSGEQSRIDATGAVILYHVVRAAYRVLKRFVTKRDHGLGPTVVEEIARELYLAAIGAEVWGTMKFDLRKHFDRGAPGTALLDRVSALTMAGKKVRLMIVTHSAGSIFACHLAHHAARSSDKLRVDLAFLAPAIRMDEAVDLLVDQPARVDNIRLFALGDKKWEQTDNLKPTKFGLIYRRSLLYLVSGVFELNRQGRSYADAPIMGMERHFRADAHHNAAEAAVRRRFRNLIAEQTPDRLVVSDTADDAPIGHQSKAKTHGGYYRDIPTDGSLVHLMLHGFD